MKILFYSRLDAGGQAQQIVSYLRKHTPHKAVNVVVENTYIDYPADVVITKDKKKDVQIMPGFPYRKERDWDKFNLMEALDEYDFFVFRWIPSNFMYDLARSGKVHADNTLIKFHGSEARYYPGEWRAFWEDSVPTHSPIIIKDNYTSVSDVLEIQDLYNQINCPVITDGKSEIKDIQRFGMYTIAGSGSQFVKIRKVMRHWYDGKLIRIITPRAYIETSKNHSIYLGMQGKNQQLVDARTVKPGDILTTANCHYLNKPYFIGNRELAWFYGFFVAEGSAFMTNRLCWIALYNKNEELLKKAYVVISENFGRKPQWCHGIESNGYIDFLKMSVVPQLYKWFRDNFYTHSGKKRIPRCIFYAPPDIQKSFIDGYIAGDGHYDERGRMMYTTNSQVLSASLNLIIEKLYDHDVSMRYDLGGRGYSSRGSFNGRINLTDNFRKEKGIVTKIEYFDYSGYLYDLETETGTFCTGIGNVKAHNTKITYVTNGYDYTLCRDLGYSAQHIPPMVPCETLWKLQLQTKLRSDGTFWIAHAPTDPAKKGTDILLKTVQKLKDHGLDIDVELITGKTYKEALQLKSECHALYDQISQDVGIGTFGVNLIEGLATSKICFGGYNKFTYSYYPDLAPGRDTIFNAHNQAELYGQIKRAYEYRDKYKSSGYELWKAGREFATSRFDTKIVGEQWRFLMEFIKEGAAR